MPCKQCNKKVSDSDRIVCRGYCGAEFHVICAKVDMPLMDQLGIHATNVFWMCDGCAKLFTDGHFRNVVGRYEGEIKSMKDDIAKLNSAVANLSGKTPVAWPNSERPLLGAKRRLQVTQTTKPTLPHSSQGKKVIELSVPLITPPANKCWIWLGSFAPSVTEDDICKLVKTCLSCDHGDDVEARALVKKETLVTSMRSVTFKVGVEEKYRDLALDANSWPQGVAFREFVDFSKKNAPNDTGSGFTKTPRLGSPSA